MGEMWGINLKMYRFDSVLIRVFTKSDIELVYHLNRSLLFLKNEIHRQDQKNKTNEVVHLEGFVLEK